MKITVIASTVLHTVPESVKDTLTGQELLDPSTGTDIDRLHEFAGRSCYKSWSKPNPKTRSNEDYMNHILDSAHESVVEHGAATFYVEGVSRSLLLELERHRHQSFSVESQRYVDTSKAHSAEDGPIIPPLLRDHVPGQAAALRKHYELSLQRYDNCFQDCRSQGFTYKEAREAARAFLPESTPVDLVLSGNIRTLRWVIKKRFAEGADREIQEFGQEILRLIKELAPNSTQDISDEPAAY